ncbi:MAG: VOC family protein [Hyphomicrobiales bacterium]|nr:VOC family protein [Hyphomicrobiales bacterium]
MFSGNSVRPVDHIVLSLPDIKLAGDRFGELGFNCATVARHSFGTENAIIPFSNGTFIEPLAIGDADAVAEYALKRHPFVVRDQAYRYRHGGSSFAGGFSMLVFSGDNAKKDQKLFRKAGLNTGKISRVKRPGLNIRTAFAMDERVNDCTLFVCERKDGIPVFDEQLTSHPNGALRLSRVVLVDDNPADFYQYLGVVSGQHDYIETEWGGDLSLANGLVSIISPSGLKCEYGVDLTSPLLRNGPRLVTYDIVVTSLDETAMMLAEKGILASQIGNRVVVANAPHQGATLAFVEE